MVAYNLHQAISLEALSDDLELFDDDLKTKYVKKMTAAVDKAISRSFVDALKGTPTLQTTTTGWVQTTATNTNTAAVNASTLTMWKQRMSQVSTSPPQAYVDAFEEAEWRRMEIERRARHKTILRNDSEYWLEDGTKLTIEPNGKVVIDDGAAKVIYRGNNIRNFNKFINASDVLEKFIEYLGSQGVSRRELKDISIEMFIMWLIISAAEADGEEKPSGEVLALESATKRMVAPRCKCCGRYISQKRLKAGVEFCSGDHADRYLEKVAA